jgi:putative ABC transport system ATP-binding protein
MEIIKKLNEEGKTIVIITHSPEVNAYAKRFVNIKD